jgi:hypothetical protein
VTNFCDLNIKIDVYQLKGNNIFSLGISNFFLNSIPSTIGCYPYQGYTLGVIK